MAAAQDFPCMHHEPVVAESLPVIAQNSETGCTVFKPESTEAAMIARIAPKSFTGLEICFLVNFLTAQEKPIVHAEVTEVIHLPEGCERHDDKRLRSGSLVLQELDGEESIIREPVKLSEGYEEPDNEANYTSYATKPRHLTPPKPWELKGEKLAEYWQEKYECMHARAENPDLRFHPSQDKHEFEKFIDEDTQFWNSRHATQLKEDGDLNTFPPDLFCWLSWGRKGSYILQNSYYTRSDPEHKLEVSAPWATATLMHHTHVTVGVEDAIDAAHQNPAAKDFKKADAPSDYPSSVSKRQILDQSMALVDNKTAPRRMALPFLGSTPVVPPIQKAAPPADSLTRPVAIVSVPKTSLVRHFTEKVIKTNEWTHRVRDIDKDFVKKFVGATCKFQPPTVIPRDPKDAPSDVKPVLKSPSPMDEHPKAERDVKGQARAHTEEDPASTKTSVSHRSSCQE
ncbi:uncharacterized protein EI90DRAFT_3020568 [Cantharellus anzutake]|uniref:uncharacterized protein n=1 Tax=Cantharellus anzutake TaxID=1750568 RepID=UPI00190749D8|nr:uncharacterized protein EI90DRAFT_3020568 [Cantharellus anzutake]KAF8320226.1 hypothetical protein EI90DRAFT_3020568 [Cantharellus anzutake]